MVQTLAKPQELKKHLKGDRSLELWKTSKLEIWHCLAWLHFWAKYLGCNYGNLRYSYTPLEKAAKFELRPSSENNNYVHIKSCYNNKYWMRMSEDDNRIFAGASEPIEDKTLWNCTVFRPVFEVIDDTEYVSFEHLQAGQNVGMNGDYELLLFPQAQTLARSRVRDYHMYVILPKYVAFKDDKGKFYQIIKDSLYYGSPFIQASGTDSGAKDIVYETSYNRHGNYRFKNFATGKFLRSNEGWIWADHLTLDEWNGDVLFWPVKVEEKVIGLRLLGNNCFVQKINKERMEDCLNASADSITDAARLTVVEPVLRRVVEVVKFRLEDARIYDHKPLIVGKNTACNMTDSAHSATLTYHRQEKMTTTWSNTVNASIKAVATFSSGIPVIAEGGLEVTAEVSDTYMMGEPKESIQDLTGSYSAAVPPHTMVATTAKCDVPFTYKQTDTLINGKIVSETFDDGMFTGVNAYDIRYEATKTDLK